jgi:hypothetical protein
MYTYMALIGGLSYVACGSGPCTCFNMKHLGGYANSPPIAHLNVAIHVLQYSKHTIDRGISLGHGSSRGDTPVHRKPERGPKSKGVKRKAH